MNKERENPHREALLDLLTGAEVGGDDLGARLLRKALREADATLTDQVAASSTREQALHAYVESDARSRCIGPWEGFTTPRNLPIFAPPVCPIREPDDQSIWCRGCVARALLAGAVVPQEKK